MGKRIAAAALDNYKIANKKKKPNAAAYLQKCSSEESSSAEDEESSTESTLSETSIKYKESPKPEYQLTQDLVNGAILTDLTQKQWRIGKPIGKGSFGEIFLASDNINSSITNDNAKYVVKIEPHSNGPLFVEIHCLLNTAKETDEEPLPLGMPQYIASGSHYFRDIRYRFLILPRYDRDLHSLIKNRRVDQKSVLILAIQILDILQHIHNKGYCHSDIKAENLMIGKCTYCRKSLQKKWNEEDNGNDNQNCDYDYDKNIEDSEISCDDDDDNDSEYKYYTPVRNRKIIPTIQYSGSNPVRSCRTNKPSTNTIYQEMINSHYLRPVKKINYSAFFNDDNSKGSIIDDDDSGTIDDYISNHRLSKSFKKSNINNKKLQQQNSIIQKTTKNDFITDENHIYLIDFGLASKFIDTNGLHRPFCMDQRRAHDGTLEFTSRDAHMGAHSRRSDLECLGYNLIFWSQGYLPWKEKADKQQHEKVHWMKEYLMTDVKEMLKHIYGKQVPKYLGDFMYYVGKLSYDERPNYIKCKKFFQTELEKLNIKSDKWQLNINEMIENSIDINDEIENNNFSEMKNIKSIMKNLGVLMPFRENNTNNRVSPKNLRSKSDKNSKKKKKKFSWAEILSQNPDQIARERAEKEYEREQTTETPVNRYTGKPTYAILEIQNRIKFKDRLDSLSNDVTNDKEQLALNFNCKGYTKPMIDIFKKRQANNRFTEVSAKKQQITLPATSATTNTINNKRNSKELAKKNTTTRTKEGLRTIITPTKRGMDYNHSIIIQKTKRRQNLFIKKSTRRTNNNIHDQLCETDESSSCSSSNISVATRSSTVSSQKSSSEEISESISSISANKRIRRYPTGSGGSSGNSNSSSIISNGAGNSGATSSSFPTSISDEDTRDVMVVIPKSKRTRDAIKKMNIKINGTGTISKEDIVVATTPITIVVSSSENNYNSNKLSRGDKNVSRRKKSVPQKRNHKGEIMRCI